MSIEKGDATKYVHTGNGELCYELNKALTVPETFPIYLSSAYIFDSIDPMIRFATRALPAMPISVLATPTPTPPLKFWRSARAARRVWCFPPAWRPSPPPFWQR